MIPLVGTRGSVGQICGELRADGKTKAAVPSRYGNFGRPCNYLDRSAARAISLLVRGAPR